MGTERGTEETVGGAQWGQRDGQKRVGGTVGTERGTEETVGGAQWDHERDSRGGSERGTQLSTDMQMQTHTSGGKIR